MYPGAGERYVNCTLTLQECHGSTCDHVVLFLIEFYTTWGCMSFALPTLFSQGRVCKKAGSRFWLTWEFAWQFMQQDGPSTSGGAILAVRQRLFVPWNQDTKMTWKTSWMCHAMVHCFSDLTQDVAGRTSNWKASSVIMPRLVVVYVVKDVWV